MGSIDLLNLTMLDVSLPGLSVLVPNKQANVSFCYVWASGESFTICVSYRFSENDWIFCFAAFFILERWEPVFSDFLRFVSISEPVWIGGIDSSKLLVACCFLEA
jgi:hypothetical protein